MHICKCLNLLADAGIIPYITVNGRIDPTSKCTGGCQSIAIKEASKKSLDQSGRPSSTGTSSSCCNLLQVVFPAIVHAIYIYIYISIV